MTKIFQATIKVELSGVDEDYEPTSEDADGVIELALHSIYSNGIGDGDLEERVIFDGYPSIRVTGNE